MTERFDITETDYEYDQEHHAYVAQFNGAIVCEESPYLIALYSSGLGGATQASEEVNGLGYVQLVQLTYVINEWHRVNHNMI
ncbi:hypothetical protein [Streptococcus pyogenes]|uniref:hypothetical protein n=1 Tax=Streptococcus pyogenes TaxID=1314 RepID=UPI00109C40DF|nr:hypothetical protein [Streptococcus pyogenes]VGQ37457.1 S11 family peptidase [Streptococcus pyogenes]VGQ72012.1 S11 family peptidase [Streptococcus pyogenes]VGW10698.1 S11 family peptidase [Streptococcus pyogenes]